MQLSAMQEDAVKKAHGWYATDNEQIFTIAGYAGTGKSTIVKELIDRLELKPYEVRYVTFTGKAALVLTMKGNPCFTIHKTIYDVDEKQDPKTGKKKRTFVKRLMIDPLIKLIVVDEVSMPNKILFNDLKSFGRKMVCLGDPGQLPPIGDDNGVLSKPDVFLTEIHRQAADNPIIHLSMLAREGKRIDYGMYGNKVVVIPKRDVTEDIMRKADIVLCGKNNTRRDLNQVMRKNLGFRGELPNIGEKILCTQNNWNEALPFVIPNGNPEIPDSVADIALINGLIGYVQHDITDVDHDMRRFKMDFRPEFISDDYFEGITVDMELDGKGGFVDFEFPLPAYMEEKGMKKDKFDFGYAITVHKSQGSSWNKVLLYNEVLNPRDHKRWIYTGITRAEDRLILAL